MLPTRSTAATTTSILSSLLLLFASAPSPSRADKEAFYDSKKYNDGDYGNYVTQDFISSPVKAPWLNFMMPFSACDDGSYYFSAPRGNVAFATPYIMDAYGSLVWAPDHHYGEVYNFLVQEYKGQQYLTFWSGDDSVGGHGEGRYHMLDQHYEEYRRIEGANGIGADLHSFAITKEDTATCSLYDIHEVDVSAVRSRQPTGYIWDSLFQEIDIETGEAIFQWRASEHCDLADSYVGINAATQDNPWDFFHINSVEKDHLGNYLVSSRFLRAILYVDGRNGTVLWQLGGKKNSFTDLSNGDATGIVGQHDAHWNDDHTVITFFDNRGDWYYQAGLQSIGKRVRLDLETMTAELLQEFKNPARIYTFAQGSYQTLPNGNVMIGYGFNGAFTEFTPDGDVLCDAYMMPRKRFGSGDVQSYRNMKYNWTGIPKTRPNIVYHRGALFMSWKGSTETRTWLLQDSTMHNGTFEDLQNVHKDGFETRVRVDNELCTKTYVRVIAVSASGEHLSTSMPIQIDHAEQRCSGALKYSGARVETKTASHEETDENDDPGDETSDDSTDADSSSSSTSAPESTTSSYSDGDAHDDLAQQVEDLQLLFGFGILALISSALVAWYLFGCRLAGPFWRSAPFPSSSSSSSTYSSAYADAFFSKSRLSSATAGMPSPRELWTRVRTAVPGTRQGWMEMYHSVTSPDFGGSDGRRGAGRRNWDEEETMLGSDASGTGDLAMEEERKDMGPP